jgi:gamma-glutamylcyclotransferase (GGCT)/AIG2-like uncharacterized protein YtfP
MAGGAAPGTARLFVYGTLMPGQVRWRLLEPLVTVVEPEPAEANGDLYGTPYGWPAAVFDETAAGAVPGLAVTLRDPERALPVLDEEEGTSAGLFERRLITTTAGACFAYHWPGPVAGFRPIPRWPSE